MSCTREATAGRRALGGAVVGGVSIESHTTVSGRRDGGGAAEALQADKKRRRDAEADAALEGGAA